jgi:hypothetical protein
VALSSPNTPPTDVPEADWAEQALEADPLAEAEEEGLAQSANTDRGLREVDDADLAEQETVAYVEDDDIRG